MLFHYFILSFCVVTYCNQDGGWFNCKPKPGCSIARCDPRPASQWLGNEGLHNEYPILCQQNKASSSATADTDITLLLKKNAEMERGLRNEIDRMKREARADKVKLNDAMKLFSEQNAKIAELTASLARAEEERKALKERDGFCFVKYNGKCFWIETNYNNIPFNKAKEMCAARRGTPADIYSEEHYNMIKDYVRRQVPAGDDILNPWLGMRFNVGTMTASLSDGTPARFLKWRPGYPRNNAGRYHIAFNVRVPWNAADQDMYNLPYNHNRRGVLCQKD